MAAIPKPSRLWLSLAFALAFAVGCAPEKPPDRRCVVQIVSDPAGATVKIDHRLLKGKTPLSVKVPKGPRLFEFSKPGRATVWKQALCVDADLKLEVELPRLTASALVQSEPAGATVLIRDKPVGETPLLLRDFKSGSHSALLRKTGYASQKVQWEIVDERPTKVFAQLGSIIGELTITSQPEGATISINGNARGKTPQAESFKLPEGQYLVKLTLPGHTSFEDALDIGRGQTKRVDAKLELLPGQINITATPANALISLSLPGGAVKQLGSSPASASNLPPGKYVVSAALPPEFDAESKEIDLVAGKTENVALALEGNTGGVDILADPPGVTLYLDGKKLGNAAPNPKDPNASLVFPVRGVGAGTHTVMVTHKNADPNRKSVTVKVEKRKIARLAPITLWVKDTYLKLTNGEEIRGHLVRENAKEVYIQRSPSITQGFPRKQIAEMKKLEDYE